MADFTAHASPDQIVSELRDNEEEFGETIALIAREVEKLTGDDEEAVRDFVASYGQRTALMALARFLTVAAGEDR